MGAGDTPAVIFMRRPQIFLGAAVHPAEAVGAAAAPVEAAVVPQVAVADHPAGAPVQVARRAEEVAAAPAAEAEAEAAAALGVLEVPAAAQAPKGGSI